jgi:hypothetical protein
MMFQKIVHGGQDLGEKVTIWDFKKCIIFRWNNRTMLWVDRRRRDGWRRWCYDEILKKDVKKKKNKQKKKETKNGAAVDWMEWKKKRKFRVWYNNIIRIINIWVGSWVLGLGYTILLFTFSFDFFSIKFLLYGMCIKCSKIKHNF